MGVALTPCTVPGGGPARLQLGEDEIELGLGIHGEPGVRRARARPADALVDELLRAIIEDRRLRTGDRVALLVNNLGGTPSDGAGHRRPERHSASWPPAVWSSSGRGPGAS